MLKSFFKYQFYFSKSTSLSKLKTSLLTPAFNLHYSTNENLTNATGKGLVIS